MTASPLSMQDAILRLQEFWARQGALLWQPYHTEVGAGTANPATFLRVLGPEPWNVGYVEPSIRPDDSRYGDNPNRLQQHTQFQVILKPDPGNPQEIYLASLEALGIDRRAHDIRFVEDNWESPALGAWGLGWEVWLDGMEITQFTYFQQSGGFTLDPVSVEITYGLERIVMALQGVDHVMKLRYAPGLTYGEVFLQNEFEQSTYNLDAADTGRVRELFDLYEAEAKHLLDQGLTISAYDYILKTSHAFNLLDARGAIGVTERAAFFNRMRQLSRRAAQSWYEAREQLGFPLLKGEAASPLASAVRPPVSTGAETAQAEATGVPSTGAGTTAAGTPGAPMAGVEPGARADFVLEIGTEELPAQYVDLGAAALQEIATRMLADLRLGYDRLTVDGTPRRLIVRVEGLAARQSDREELVRGPAAAVAFDAEGRPTKAAIGFARSKGLDPTALERREVGGAEYVFGVAREAGRPAGEALADALPGLIGGIVWPKSMRWNATNVAFGRPIRWIVALLGDRIVPFAFAGVESGRTSRGLRPAGSPEFAVPDASHFDDALREIHILPPIPERKRRIWEAVEQLAAEVEGHALPSAEADLLDEVANLVEAPTPIRGGFEESYLTLPDEVLTTVMRKHQRYFPVVGADGKLLPAFVGVANGAVDEAVVRRGYEEVIRARYADARFFWERDTQKPLAAFRPALAGLIFQEKLGSMLDKTGRIEAIVTALARDLGLSGEERRTAERAAHLAKADLVTEMVMDFTSLQGIMGRHYAARSGESDAVARAIEEQYSNAPDTLPGLAVGLADRLDSLVGLFAIGKAPKSNADPFAQRRAAIGVIELLAGRGIRFDLRRALDAVASVQPVPVTDGAKAEVLEFIVRRLEQWLLDRGHPSDVVDAALGGRGHDPAGALETAEQLARVVDDEEFKKTLTAYARPARITRGKELSTAVDPALFEHDEERALWDAYNRAAESLGVSADGEAASVSTDGESGSVPADGKAGSVSTDGRAGGGRADFNALLRELDALRSPIDTYFDKVFVMADDERIRDNRLALLKRIADLAAGIVDLSEIQGF